LEGNQQKLMRHGERVFHNAALNGRSESQRWHVRKNGPRLWALTISYPCATVRSRPEARASAKGEFIVRLPLLGGGQRITPT